MEVYAAISACAGSKELPNMNICTDAGKLLLALRRAFAKPLPGIDMVLLNE